MNSSFFKDRDELLNFMDALKTTQQMILQFQNHIATTTSPKKDDTCTSSVEQPDDKQMDDAENEKEKKEDETVVVPPEQQTSIDDSEAGLDLQPAFNFDSDEELEKFIFSPSELDFENPCKNPSPIKSRTPSPNIQETINSPFSTTSLSPNTVEHPPYRGGKCFASMLKRKNEEEYISHNIKRMVKTPNKRGLRIGDPRSCIRCLDEGLICSVKKPCVSCKKARVKYCTCETGTWCGDDNY